MEVNVKVAVRVRPLLQKEKLASESICVRVIPSTSQLVLGKDRPFTFDHIFPSKSTQDEVYNMCVRGLVQTCFDGYNATVFAYGQTGSGKTYTMGGGDISSQTEDDFGIIPHAIRDTFELVQANSERSIKVKVSYIEIYKEELRDLLELETSTRDIHIREDQDGNTIVIGTTEVECTSEDEVLTLLQQGSSYRHTASTQMNDHSSRSHSIFTVFIEQQWRDDNNTQADLSEEDVYDLSDMEHFVCAKFSFVDLAGSERAHRTGNVGDRFKESVHINSGLLALGNVISALGDIKKKVSHIPYRESKITRLLKDSLGGNSQTLMICCISPASSSFDESLNALKYANRAKDIKNKPIINRDPKSLRFEEMKTEIQALKQELERQRTSAMTQRADNGNSDQILMKNLQVDMDRLQTECSHYKLVAEEAYSHLQEVQARHLVSSSLKERLDEWLQLMEELQHQVPAHIGQKLKQESNGQQVKQLQAELARCQKDLNSDEEIFAEKAKEITALQERIAQLEKEKRKQEEQNANLQHRLKEQEQHLVEKQVAVDSLVAELKEAQAKLSEKTEEVVPSRTPVISRRIQSAPSKRHLLSAGGHSRNIHTSPANLHKSLDKVLQGFRARSQILQDRLEDEDEVLQDPFTDDEDSEEDTDVALSDEDENVAEGNFKRNTPRRGTYKVNKPRSNTDQPDEGTESGNRLLNGGGTFSRGSSNILRVESEPVRSCKGQLRSAQVEVRQSTAKLRELAMNIRLKEQLIRDLVKTGKDAQAMNMQYRQHISSLQQEKGALEQELSRLQTALQHQATSSSKDVLESEYRKKMERMNILKKQQKDTEKLVSITGTDERKIQGLERAVEKMRNQHDLLQKRLKDETDRRQKLQKEVEREQRQVKELELKNEQQQKVLKVKVEEVSAMQRRLRGNIAGARHHNASYAHHCITDEKNKLDEQRKILDEEVERVLEQRHRMDQLQKELQRREDDVAKREAFLAEKSELEIKKLRASQMLSKEQADIAVELDRVEKQLHQAGSSALTPLQQRREQLLSQRKEIDHRMVQGEVLNTADEHRLTQLVEELETLDTAIEYRNQRIEAKENELRKSMAAVQQSQQSLLAWLNGLSSPEIRSLLTKYFEKVVELQEHNRHKDLTNSQLQVKVEEQDRLIGELQASLQRQAMELDRQLTKQQQQYEHKIQALVQQLEKGPQQSDERQQLEKDLFYYKKTCRDLKRKLREITSQIMGQQPGAAGDTLQSSTESLQSVKSKQGAAKNGTPRRSQSERGPTSSSQNGSAVMPSHGEKRHSQEKGRDVLVDSLEARSSDKNPWN